MRQAQEPALEPRAHFVLNGVLLAVTLLPAMAIGLLVAVSNAVVQRDPRRVFFLQERVGRHGRVFRIVKFRTMREVSDPFGCWKDGNRLRVTAFGKFLRDTHLDELPQILNVLRGEMSFIGPRPEMVEVERWADEKVHGFSSRLELKPGITGLAQVTQGYTGHEVEAYAEKLRINERYLRERSLGLDLWILGRTFVAILAPAVTAMWKYSGYCVRQVALLPRGVRHPRCKAPEVAQEPSIQGEDEGVAPPLPGRSRERVERVDVLRP